MTGFLDVVRDATEEQLVALRSLGKIPPLTPVEDEILKVFHRMYLSKSGVMISFGEMNDFFEFQGITDGLVRDDFSRLIFALEAHETKAVKLANEEKKRQRENEKRLAEAKKRMSR